MPADSPENISVEQQALKAIAYLNPEEQRKVLAYIMSLINLEKTKNDKSSAT
jgi:hypothetical protein